VLGLLHNFHCNTGAVMNQTTDATGTVLHANTRGDWEDIFTNGAFLVMVGVACVSLVFITFFYCFIATVYNKLNEWNRGSATVQLQPVQSSWLTEQCNGNPRPPRPPRPTRYTDSYPEHHQST
jgi:hypothetical protein